MATHRLADRQIRAAAHAALRLDVRGPVSQALARTGIPVPPADDTTEAPPTISAPERTPAPRAYGQAAPRVLKPFAEAPWPTRRPAAPDPLSGLTADERRVHRILIDTLALQPTDGFTPASALGRAERARLERLDLPFIDAELATMTGGTVDVRRWTAVSTAVLGGLVLALAVSGATAATAGLLATGVLLLVVSAAVATGLIPTSAGGGAGQRPAIYRALRELALLAHADAVASDALTQADALIDRLAHADQAPAPLLDLSDRPGDDAPRRRPRVRS